MNIFVYSDESGVLDKEHNEYFVFGGLVFLSRTDKDIYTRKYMKAEKVARDREKLSEDDEVKATSVSNSTKGKLFRSLNRVEKFGIVVHQKRLFDSVFVSKKSKQRYLDWAYKYAVRRKLEMLIGENKIIPDEVERIYFFVDQHTTATNGIYELKESIESEFKDGVHTNNYTVFRPPLFENLIEVNVVYCDSKVKPLVRAADIVANKIYHSAITNDYSTLENRNLFIEHHPFIT